MLIKFKRLSPKAMVPKKKNGDAGYDLHSLEDYYIDPFERKLINTGLAIEIPEGYYGRIAPRSGLAIKNGIDVMAGVIDSTYRDELKVVLINFDCIPLLTDLLSNKASFDGAFSSLFGPKGRFKIKAGDRIAQIIFEKYHDVSFIEQELSVSDRIGGFGSTGV